MRLLVLDMTNMRQSRVETQVLIILWVDPCGLSPSSMPLKKTLTLWCLVQANQHKKNFAISLQFVHFSMIICVIAVANGMLFVKLAKQRRLYFTSYATLQLFYVCVSQLFLCIYGWDNFTTTQQTPRPYVFTPTNIWNQFKAHLTTLKGNSIGLLNYMTLTCQHNSLLEFITT